MEKELFARERHFRLKGGYKNSSGQFKIQRRKKVHIKKVKGEKKDEYEREKKEVSKRKLYIIHRE